MERKRALSSQDSCKTSTKFPAGVDGSHRETEEREKTQTMRDGETETERQRQTRGHRDTGTKRGKASDVHTYRLGATWPEQDAERETETERPRVEG